MADDFLVEEESSNRTFLIVAGGMAGLLLLGLVAIVVIAFMRRGGDANNEIAIMNQTIEAQNQFVTQTVAAMEAQAAYTATPSPIPPTKAPTAIPTFTPSPIPPTPTSVVQTPVAEETETAEPVSLAAAEITVTPAPTTAPAETTLPASGLSMWQILVASAGLIVVIVLVRRLRPAI